MTTTPKSKCCGVDTFIYTDMNLKSHLLCSKCKEKVQDQPDSQLDEVVKKYSARVVTLEKLIDDTIVGEYMRSAIQEYSAEATKEKCKTCGCLYNPSYVESGECIFCIAKQLHQSLTKANEELVELRKDKEVLNKIYSNADEPLRQIIDSAIAAQEKMK